MRNQRGAADVSLIRREGMGRKLFGFLLVTLILVGCAAPGLAPTPTEVKIQPSPTPTQPQKIEVRLQPYSPLPAPTPTPQARPEDILSRAVNRAIADLAGRLGIPEGEIEVVSASWEEMPIQDVECGRPEEKITLPAFVMGIEVVLVAQGKTYVYRGRGEMVKLCAPEGEPESLVIRKVKEAFKDYPPEEIKVISVEEVVWPDTSLGCPEPGKFYAQVLVPGYRVILEVGGRRVEVHTDLRGRFVICTPKGQ
jgi:hypothetical protein